MTQETIVVDIEFYDKHFAYIKTVYGVVLAEPTNNPVHYDVPEGARYFRAVKR